MFAFNSLRSRITALSIGVFGLMLVVVAVGMQWAIEANAESKVEAELQASSRIIDRVWELRQQELENVANPLALDFGFRAAVATDDVETVRSALRNIAGRIDLPHAFVLDYEGHLIAASSADDRQFDGELWDRLDSGWYSGVLRVNDRTLQAVAAEINAPSLIGWLVIGRELDQAELRELGALSAVPVQPSVIRLGTEGEWVDDQSGEPLASPEIVQLLDALSRGATAGRGHVSQRVDDTVVFVRPLGQSDGQLTSALRLDFAFADAMAEYNALRWTVALAGMLGLVFIGLAASWLGRRIAGPIAVLDRAAHALAEGRRTRVPVQSSDEIGRLSKSFNLMSRQIVEREARIGHLAYHDMLTELPNRLKLEELIYERLQAGEGVALCCIGLDNFKIINDTLGHDCGDKLLQAFVSRASEHANGATLARIGGDQFCLIAADEPGATDLLKSLSHSLEAPFAIGAHHLRVGITSGLSIAPEDGDSAEQLIRNAELAMFHAKQQRRGSVHRFTVDLDHRASKRREIEADLHIAIKEGQFELYFQPLFDLATNRFSAFEALIRWHHPTKGMISPVDFIPVAEESGMIVPIGEWVLKDACRQAARWPGEIKVAVNFSTVQFQSDSLRNTVFQALATSSLAPDRLEVEITESLFLADSEAILATLRGFKELGVRIALDDFGTGYSSLSYLRKFPFDKVKIDRSFITELLEDGDAGAVVAAITQLASALGMETTAEGVEHPEQVDLLREHGCTNVQGFYFSKPVPGDRVFELLDGGALRRSA